MNKKYLLVITLYICLTSILNALSYINSGITVLDNNTVSLNISSFRDIYYDIYFKIDDEGNEIYFGRGHNLDVNKEDNLVLYTYDNLWGCLDWNLVTMIYVNEDKSSINYKVPILINNKEASLNIKYNKSLESYSILGYNFPKDKMLPLKIGDEVTTRVILCNVRNEEDKRYKNITTIICSEYTNFSKTKMGYGEYILRFTAIDTNGNKETIGSVLYEYSREYLKCSVIE